MAEAPELDGRRAAAISAEIAELAPYYTDDWNPEAGGVGAGLVDVFAELGAEVTERLDAAPAKHRIAFFETLGFSARPPQAARVPVQFTLAPEAPRNVAVRPGTAAIAAASEEVTFQVAAADAFEATPARLTDVLAVDPDEDAVYDHGDLIDGGGEGRPWTGEDRQAHEWYVGDADLLSAGAGDEIVVDLDAAVDEYVLVEQAEWHYYGTDGDDGPERWHRLDEPDPNAFDPVGDVAITLQPAGPLVEYAVDGVESKWLRCRLPADRTPDGERAFTVNTVGITTQSGGEGIAPDALLANDVPQEAGKSDSAAITPFGDHPRPGDTFYVASGSAFSKPGAAVTLTLTPTGEAGETAPDGSGDLYREAESGQSKVVEKLDLPPDIVEQLQAAADRGGDPSLSWEYWDGEGWARLDLDADGTESLTASEPATVEFTVPSDLAPTAVAGHDGHWIRVRLVGGDYGSAIQVPQNPEGTRWAQQLGGSPPELETITVSYGLNQRSLPEHVRSRNALAWTAHDPDEEFDPFRPLPEATQTLYLGFDKPLSSGPLQVFAAVDEHRYPADFTPRLQWERRHPHKTGWTRPDVTDDTADLTEQGLLGFGFAEATRATERFGRERHWLRARVTDERFDPRAGGESSDENDGDAGGSDGDGEDGLVPCGDAVETQPPGGERSARPPKLTGLYMNTGWARNVETVEGELLGGSDGERDQTFAVANPPAVDPTVWVDELNSLSEPQREALREERPEDVEVEYTTDDAVRAFWVRWEAVPDLLDSGSDARHFAVDATAGEIRFGDGERGRIPPRGTDNVRADYRTGGGAAGNVPAGAVGELKSGLPFVDAVTNPAPGAGGADAESTAAVLDRAPQELRDRGRAVMPADYERIAADASRRVARAECIPAMNGDGAYEPGFVTVLVVPHASDETPIPSLGLLDRVETVLGDHAPVGVIERDRLIVRGPSYVDVGVDADVVAGDVGSLTALEARLQEALADFLHPLSGAGGKGWDFGELPTRSDCFALLEGVEGVDHVASLVLTLTGTETLEVGEGDPQPAVAADALVRAGEHALTVELGGGD